ncbi:MAG: DegT/DnrJ/EryC1/StrS family aminotransferase [Phycisphaerales bacterium]|nr:MAG: DegT/DnrJ/EryC1/StrS family aminotransferase [Phycisphaerales bacterium]
MRNLPFLKPSLVTLESYSEYINLIDKNQVYSNFGPLNTLFERRILDRLFDGGGTVCTVGNATLGLILAISAVKRPSGRYAVMPSFTFAATALAAKWCGLEPYFVDIRADDFCMDTTILAGVLDELEDEVGAVVPYAAFGVGLDLTPYRELAESGVPVVIDAAASAGTRVGNSGFGTNFPGLIVFSLHATKAFGIGEGGLVYSGSPPLVDAVRRASNFGFSSDRECVTDGLNAKLSEYGAAIGLATLDVFTDKMEARWRVREMYIDQFKVAGMFDDGWAVQKVDGVVPCQFMTALCPDSGNGAEYVSRLAQANIDARTYFSPACHQQGNFIGAPRTSMAVTENVSRRVVSLPLWEGMTRNEVDRVIAGLVGE